MFITQAFADTGAAATTAAPNTTQSIMSTLPIIALLVLFMYFMVIRPQTKRSKEHKTLVSSLQKGDEVMTIGGILGRIEKIEDTFVVLTIATNTNITVQKSAIANIVPRGTMKGV